MNKDSKIPNQAYFKQQLLLKKKAIQLETEVGMDSAAAVTLDQSGVGRISRVTALQDQAISVAAQERRAADLRDIEAALMRVKEGEYGYCQNCGVDIALSRLEINLSTKYCIKCASQHEKDWKRDRQ